MQTFLFEKHLTFDISHFKIKVKNMSKEEIEQFNINFQIQYLTAKTTFLSSSYIAKKILKNKINTKVKELKLLQQFNQ